MHPPRRRRSGCAVLSPPLYGTHCGNQLHSCPVIAAFRFYGRMGRHWTTLLLFPPLPAVYRGLPELVNRSPAVGSGRLRVGGQALSRAVCFEIQKHQSRHKKIQYRVLTLLSTGFNMLMNRSKKSRCAGCTVADREVTSMMTPSFVPSEDLARMLMHYRPRTTVRRGEVVRLNRIFHRSNRDRREP